MPAVASAGSVNEAQPGVPAGATLPDDLDLAEMMRVLDVALALKREGYVVEQQFNLEKTREALRDRLWRTAVLRGETLTPEQLEAAINWYLENMHGFREPQPGIATTLAHLYIRRSLIGACLLATSLVLLGLWWTSTSSWSPVSPAGRRIRQESAAARRKAAEAELQQAVTRKKDLEIADASAAIAREIDLMQALSPGGAEMAEQLQRWTAQAVAFKRNRDAAQLQRLADELARRRDQLDDEYTVAVVLVQNSRSAFERNYEDEQGKRLSGYYLIVQARDAAGRVVPRRIVNVETGREEVVETWAERVPKDVYERLKADKLEDGILTETQFAVKRSGELEDRVVMPGPNGQPLHRDAQITKW